MFELDMVKSDSMVGVCIYTHTYVRTSGRNSCSATIGHVMKLLGKNYIQAEPYIRLIHPKDVES